MKTIETLFLASFAKNVVKNPSRFVNFANRNLVNAGLHIAYHHKPYNLLDEDTTIDVRKGHDKCYIYNTFDNVCKGYGSFNHALTIALNVRACINDLKVLSAQTRSKVIYDFLLSVFNKATDDDVISDNCKEIANAIADYSKCVGIDDIEVLLDEWTTIDEPLDLAYIITTSLVSINDEGALSVVNPFKADTPLPTKKYMVEVSCTCTRTIEVDAVNQADAEDKATNICIEEGFKTFTLSSGFHVEDVIEVVG